MRTKEKWGKLLDEYYQDRGWDVKTGFPTKKKLTLLNLKEFAKDLPS